MTISTRKYIRHLVGASCAAALLAATVGVASAETVSLTTGETSRAAPHGDCTGYHYDENRNRIWDPAGCTPP
ncbi:hypothetical protein GCM10011579_092560 [Streptomyces albiflavescens]|uniref:Secreted protein n=1 Tax=Streptomyces albiflavescens TaxID=1623582 RepID=A0A917YF23_9ACTN|nr:hypothetical protein [Streptomyces albiflavescens]GGN93765.1 hypothetical protein GCM10011579_092560 [Streptomyces albiflavescens]